MSKWVQPILEAADHAEIPTTAAQRPVEIGVLGRTDLANLAVRGDELERLNIIAGESELTHETTLASSKRQTCDAGVGSSPKRRHETGCLRLGVKFSEQHSRLRADQALIPIDLDLAHRRQIDHEAALTRRLPRDAVAAAPHGGQQRMRVRELDRVHDVLAALAAGDERGMPIDRAIPHTPRLIISGILGKKQLAPEGRPKLLHFCPSQHDRLSFTGDRRHLRRYGTGAGNVGP